MNRTATRALCQPLLQPNWSAHLLRYLYIRDLDKAWEEAHEGPWVDYEWWTHHQRIRSKDVVWKKLIQFLKLYPKLCISSSCFCHSSWLKAPMEEEKWGPQFCCSTSCLYNSNVMLMQKPSGCRHLKTIKLPGTHFCKAREWLNRKTSFTLMFENIQGLR